MVTNFFISYCAINGNFSSILHAKNIFNGMKLFSEEKKTFEETSLKNAKLFYCENFWMKAEADNFFKILQEELFWQQGAIKIFGKNILEPRLTAWYADEGKTYTYSGVKREPLAWHPILKKIKTDIELSTENLTNLPLELNSVLCNYYRDGNDSMGYHADNEKELGVNPIIVSVNFGASRRFLLKHRTEKNLKSEILLTHGSVLIMAGEMQHHWLHAIPKSTQIIKPRINLTFRNIKLNV